VRRAKSFTRTRIAQQPSHIPAPFQITIADQHAIARRARIQMGLGRERAMIAAGAEVEMQQISKRQRVLFRVGMIVAILMILWALGVFRSSPPVVY
jgi:hypothetical protein